MITALLASCGTPVNTNTGSDTGTNTSTDDSNVPTVPKPEPEIYTSTWQFTYEFFWDRSVLIGEPYACLLVDNMELVGFDGITIPTDIIAGDTITVQYTGSISVENNDIMEKMCLDGNVVSYAFGYANVAHLSGDDFSIEDIKENYDYENAYVILDRYGRFTTLDEYKGNEIYLVADQKRLQEFGEDEEGQTAKYPIACMLAYNPRELDDGANLRNQKVTIDLEPNNPSTSISSTDLSWRYAGYVGYNENGNLYIKYAPNFYNYLLLISCTGDTIEAWELIEEIVELEKIDISLVLLGNKIMIDFPSFDAYSLVQEELLDALSNLESVEKIEVGYKEASDSDKKVVGYELYQDFIPIDCESESILIKTYAEFTELFDLTDEENTSIREITEETFENNYVLFTLIGCGDCADEILIADARLIDGTLYFVQYDGYYTSGLHCDVALIVTRLVVIPKSDLGTTIPDEFDIKTISRDIYIEKVDE